MNKIKISIRLFVITIGLLLCIQSPVFAATGKSTGSCVRIRKAPSTDSEVLEVLATDDEVQILGKEGDWYKITAKGFTGYVSQSFISTNDTINETNKKNEDNNTQTQETPKNETKQENNQIDDNKKTSQQETSANKKYKITENTNVNILPVITSEFIGEIKKDEQVTLIINAGLWVYVESNNINGWIRIDKLSTENVNTDTDSNKDNTQVDNNQDNKKDENKDNNKQVDTNNAKITNYDSPKTMYVKSEAVNVRNQANTNSDIVGSLGINAEVSVVGEEDNWYKVQVDGKNGYIRNDLLSNQKTEVTSRSNNVERTVNTDVNTNNQTIVTQENPVVNQTSTTEATTSSSAVTGSDIASYAQQFVGCRYVYGAAGPTTFDCSGLTKYVYAHFGITLNRTSRDQATQGTAVTGDLQPGDILVFSNDGKTVGHVGIYIGNDKFVHASDSSTGVIISNLSDRWNISKYWGARRIL